MFQSWLVDHVKHWVNIKFCKKLRKTITEMLQMLRRVGQAYDVYIHGMTSLGRFVLSLGDNPCSRWPAT